LKLEIDETVLARSVAPFDEA